jgi:nitroreductase
MDYEQVKSLFIDRISIRDYSNKDVDNDLIIKMIEAASYAPTSCNRQSFKVKIIKKDSTSYELLSLANYGGSGFASKVPALLLVLVDLRSYSMPMEMNYPINDGSIFATYLMLTARSLGLDTCWVSWQTNKRKKQKIFNLMNIPEYYLPICVLTLGYRKDKALESPREEPNYYILK